VSVGLRLYDSVRVRQTEWQTVAVRVSVSRTVYVTVRQTEWQTVAVRVSVSRTVYVTV